MQENYLDIPVGETKGFSDKDLSKIKMLYNFISRKKQNITNCNKLFIAGPEFHSYQPDEVAVRPRKKSNAYLGLSREQSSANSDSKQSAKESTEDEVTDNVSLTSNEKSDDTNQKLLSVDKSTRENNVNVRHQQLKYETLLQNPLSILSDYQTVGK